MEMWDLMLLAYALGNVLSSPSQDCVPLGIESPYVYRGETSTPPPDGYSPFYINFLGRHSGRYANCTQSIKVWRELLNDAAEKQKLTPKGDTLEKQLEKLSDLTKQSMRQNKLKGEYIEGELAKRMYEKYPEVFGRKVVAVSTHTERTKESMRTFLEELGQHTSKKRFKVSSNGKVDPVLRFFELNKEYLQYKKEGSWREQIKMYRNKKSCTADILALFFEPSYIGSIKEPDELVFGLYTIYRNQYDKEAQVGIGKHFTGEQLRYLQEESNLSTYLTKGPSSEYQYLPTHMAFGLLGDFLVTTEKAINSNDLSAHLRFAHAETIIPFMSLLKVKGHSTQTNKMDEVASIWREEKIAPKGANIYWVLYRHDETDEILLKMFHNEEEVELPIESDIKPYYRWSKVRGYYIQMMEHMGIEWRGNMVEMVRDYTHTH